MYIFPIIYHFFIRVYGMWVWFTSYQTFIGTSCLPPRCPVSFLFPPPLFLSLSLCKHFRNSLWTFLSHWPLICSSELGMLWALMLAGGGIFLPHTLQFWCTSWFSQNPFPRDTHLPWVQEEHLWKDFEFTFWVCYRFTQCLVMFYVNFSVFEDTIN